MGRETGIGWTEATWNPWWGCQRVNEDCIHCYAEQLAARYGHDVWGGRKSARRLFADKHWQEPLAWNRQAEKRGKPMLVFCASMADVFEQHPAIAGERDRLFDLIEQTPWLVWQLLTKRPEAARDYLRTFYDEREPTWWHSRDGLGWGVLPNIWIGVSIGHAGATWHADVLREIPAAVRFISAEPLTTSLLSDAPTPLDLSGIDQLIVGGESGGRDARPMHPTWAKELRDACLGYAADAIGKVAVLPPRPAFFFKQWGSWAYDRERPDTLLGFDSSRMAPADAGDLSDLGNPYRLLYPMRYMGPSPKAGGKLLDGREWCEIPDPLSPALTLV